MNVIIVGGGVIGLATAWRSLARGLNVTVIAPPSDAGEATHVSGGMLPGVTGQLYGQESLLRLYLASRDRFPSFVAELEETAGRPAGYRRDGVLDAAFTDDDLPALDRLRSFQQSHGITTETLTPTDCLKHEPALDPSVKGGLLSPDDGAVDPRTLTIALRSAITRLGGTLIPDHADDIVLENGRAVGVRLRNGDTLHGDTVRGDRIVLAAGCWTHRIGGLPPGTIPEVTPVKGQILLLRSNPSFLRVTTRALTAGSALYLIPRLNGDLAVGATYEERGYDTTVTVGGVSELLRKAERVLPGVGTLEFAEAGVGLRPASPDELPMIGATSVPGLLLASGHFRMGVHLSPVTADIITDLLTTGETPELATPFTPLRFQ